MLWWVVVVLQWQRVRGVDTTWTSVVGDGGNAVGRAMAGVWAARAAVAATAVQRYVRAKWHGGWLEREGREVTGQSLRAATWNTQKLMVSRRWSGATNAKLEWLAQRLEDSNCDVVSLQELDGSLHTLRRLRRWLAVRGYEAAVLPGEGAVNGVAIAWRRDTLAMQGKAGALENRVLAVKLTRLADGMDFGVVTVHGIHGKEEDCCDQFREATGWLGGQEGGLLMGDLNRVPCVRWRAGAHVLGKADAFLRRWQGARGCTCCQTAQGGEEGEGEGAELIEDPRRRGTAEEHSTRVELRKGVAPRWTARLDQIWACGTEMGGWALDGLIRAETDGGGARGTRLISDHVWVEASRTGALYIM